MKITPNFTNFLLDSIYYDTLSPDFTFGACLRFLDSNLNNLL